MANGDCITCIVIVVFLSVIALIPMTVLWSENTMPTANLQDLYIPALNTKLPNFNSSTTTATFVFFDLELKNRMEEIGVRYRNADLVFYYVTPKSSFPISNYTILDFYQGHKKTAHLRDVVETRGMPWLEAFAAVSNGSAVVLKVELSTAVKLKGGFRSHSKTKELLLGANVEVNDYGEKVQKKDIKLNPSS